MVVDGLTVGGVVLCGGRSRRIGSSEAWLQRMVRIVGEVVEPVVVAGRRNQSLPELPEGVAVVCDAVEDAGPLAGITNANALCYKLNQRQIPCIVVKP